MPIGEEESFGVTPQVFVQYAVTEVELNGFINTAFHGQHRVVAGVENLVLPPGVHEVHDLGGEVLRRVGRGH